MLDFVLLLPWGWSNWYCSAVPFLMAWSWTRMTEQDFLALGPTSRKSSWRVASFHAWCLLQGYSQCACYHLVWYIITQRLGHASTWLWIPTETLWSLALMPEINTLTLDSIIFSEPNHSANLPRDSTQPCHNDFRRKPQETWWFWVLVKAQQKSVGWLLFKNSF